MSSLLPQPEPADPVEGAPGHFEHTNWVKASLKALDAGLLRKVGNQLLDGALTTRALIVQGAANTAHVYLKANGVRTVTGVANDDTLRWSLQLGDATADGASDAGSLFKLLAYGNDGIVKFTALQGSRADGLLTVKGAPTNPSGIASKKYVDDSMPIGAIIAYGGSSAPEGWHLCDGTAHGSSALAGVLGGSATTPDLRSKFIVGANANAPGAPPLGAGLTSYTPRQTGIGAETVLLTGAQSGTAAHSHAASTDIQDTNHKHSANPPRTLSEIHDRDHSHGVDITSGSVNRNASHGHGIHQGSVYGPYTGANQDGDISYRASPTKYASLILPTGGIVHTDTNHEHRVLGNTGGTNEGHYHWVDIPEFETGFATASHRHAVTIGQSTAATATQAHENRPPAFALVYIIKKV